MDVVGDIVASILLSLSLLFVGEIMIGDGDDSDDVDDGGATVVGKIVAFIISHVNVGDIALLVGVLLLLDQDDGGIDDDAAGAGAGTAG